MNQLKNCDVIPVAEIITENLTADFSSFQKFSNLFTDSYLADFNRSVKELRSKIYPSDLGQKLQESNAKYQEIILDIRSKLQNIEDMCNFNKAKLVVARGHFKLFEIRRALRKNNVKKANAELERTIEAIRGNMSTMEGVGFNSTLIEEIEALRTQLLEQRKSVEEYNGQLTTQIKEHESSIQALKKQLSFINKFGKLIFGKTDLKRRELYTMADLISRVHSKQKR